MNRSRFCLALLTSIAGVVLSGPLTIALANDALAPVAQAKATPTVTDDWEFSSQQRYVQPRTGATRTGTTRVGTRIGYYNGRIGYYNGRIGYYNGRIGYYNGRVGYFNGRYGRYGQVGRIGYVPVPAPLPGPGIVSPGPTCPVCPPVACTLATFSEQNLTGRSQEFGDNQPRLDTIGWQNEIASLLVKSGTWDFYSELEYKGQVIRLAAGSYPVLEPQWTKRIGSFMCVR